MWFFIGKPLLSSSPLTFLQESHVKFHSFIQGFQRYSFIISVNHAAFFLGQTHSGKAVYSVSDTAVMSGITAGQHLIRRDKCLRPGLTNGFFQGIPGFIFGIRKNGRIHSVHQFDMNSVISYNFLQTLCSRFYGITSQKAHIDSKRSLWRKHIICLTSFRPGNGDCSTKQCI